MIEKKEEFYKADEKKEEEEEDTRKGSNEGMNGDNNVRQLYERRLEEL